MPSIQDVADQINAKLDAINQNTASTTQNTADTLVIVGDIRAQATQINTRLAAIDADVQLGFSNLSQGLFLVQELEKVSIGLLDHNRLQNDTIICLLQNSNEILCGITRKLTEQLELSAAALKSARRMEGIEERVHAAEAAEYDRYQKLQSEIEACCPPGEKPLEPCPEDCKAPDYKPIPPRGLNWQPLPDPKDPDPIG